jgi:hypothetical protein
MDLGFAGTEKGTSVAEKCFSVTDLTKSAMEKCFSVMDLIKSMTDGGRKFTTKTKSVTDFVKNKGFLRTGLMEDRTDAPENPLAWPMLEFSCHWVGHLIMAVRRLHHF